MNEISIHMEGAQKKAQPGIGLGSNTKEDLRAYSSIIRAFMREFADVGELGYRIPKDSDEDFQRQRKAMTTAWFAGMTRECLDALGSPRSGLVGRLKRSSSYSAKHLVEHLARRQGRAIYVRHAALMVAAWHLGWQPSRLSIGSRNARLWRAS